MIPQAQKSKEEEPIVDRFLKALREEELVGTVLRVVGSFFRQLFYFQSLGVRGVTESDTEGGSRDVLHSSSGSCMGSVMSSVSSVGGATLTS